MTLARPGHPDTPPICPQSNIRYKLKTRAYSSSENVEKSSARPPNDVRSAIHQRRATSASKIYSTDDEIIVHIIIRYYRNIHFDVCM